MADKLSELTWTSFTKKQKLALDDAPLVKALARLDKTDDAKPEPRKAALDDVIEQVKKQVAAQAKRKKELGDKVFGEVKDKLYELLDLAEKAHKLAESALAKSKQTTEGDEEEDSPALLGPKMLPLLRELRKGEATMHALICTAGKNTAVLVMRRPIATGRRKMLSESVDAKAGAKFIVGECRYENKALTFIVQSAAAGLAKRLRQALLDQTQLRMKVVVRGEDGEDQDGEDAEEGGPDADTGQPSQAAVLAAAYTQRREELQERLLQALRAQHPEASRLRAVSAFADEKAGARDYVAAGKALDMLDKLLATPEPGASKGEPTGGVDARLAFKARMTALIPRLKEAQAAGAPGAAQAKLKASEAGVFAGKNEFAHAEELLDEVEELLEARPSGSDADAEGDETENEDENLAEADTDPLAPPPTPGPSIVAVNKARLEWEAARKKVRAELQRMQQAIVLAVEDESDAEQVTAASVDLFDVLDVLDESLIDILDDLLNAEDGGRRFALRQQALAKLDEYADYVATDELVQSIDDNPFTKVQVRSTLESTLRNLRTKLG
jgi:hypothetical protein